MFKSNDYKYKSKSMPMVIHY